MISPNVQSSPAEQADLVSVNPAFKILVASPPQLTYKLHDIMADRYVPSAFLIASADMRSLSFPKDRGKFLIC